MWRNALSWMSAGTDGISAACVAAASGMLAACGGGGGSSAPSIALNATSVNFADQQLGSRSPASVVSVTNDGNATLDVSAIQLSGANSAAFSQRSEERRVGKECR